MEPPIFAIRKSFSLWDNWGKIWYGQRGQRWKYNKSHALCMLDNYDYRHTLRISNTYLSTATMVKQTRHSVMFYAHCLFCNVWHHHVCTLWGHVIFHFSDPTLGPTRHQQLKRLMYATITAYSDVTSNHSEIRTLISSKMYMEVLWHKLKMVGR
jgi:hypothetical protein